LGFNGDDLGEGVSGGLRVVLSVDGLLGLSYDVSIGIGEHYGVDILPSSGHDCSDLFGFA